MVAKVPGAPALSGARCTSKLVTATHDTQFTVSVVAVMSAKVGAVVTPGSGSIVSVTSNGAAAPSLSWAVPVAWTVVTVVPLAVMGRGSFHPLGGAAVGPRKIITAAPSFGTGDCGL